MTLGANTFIALKAISGRCDSLTCMLADVFPVSLSRLKVLGGQVSEGSPPQSRAETTQPRRHGLAVPGQAPVPTPSSTSNGLLHDSNKGGLFVSSCVKQDYPANAPVGSGFSEDKII